MTTVKTKEALKGAMFQIGDFTYGVPTVRGYTVGENQGKLVIGKFCSIADQVVIFLGGNHRADWITTYPFMLFPKDWPSARTLKGHPQSKGGVIIGNDVWIGFRATIMSGVKVGDGAIIGAGAVVTSDVSPYEVVAGNPARHIRFRFSDEIIRRLLKVKWWNWHPKVVAKHAELLCSANVERLVMRQAEYEHYKAVSDRED